MNQNFFQSPPTQETEESKLEKNIRVIENLKCSLEGRVGMILVLLGLRPATSLDIFINDENLESVKQKLKEANLFFDDITKPPFENKEMVASLIVAKEQSNASVAAFLFKDLNKNQKEIALYMGHPETSAGAFVGAKKKIGDEEKFKIFKDHNISQSVAGFVLSHDNWQEEIKTAENWCEVLKLKAPELYKKVMDTEKIEQ